MFIGHFAVGFAAKRSPRTSLGIHAEAVLLTRAWWFDRHREVRLVIA